MKDLVNRDVAENAQDREGSGISAPPAKEVNTDSAEGRGEGTLGVCQYPRCQSFPQTRPQQADTAWGPSQGGVSLRAALGMRSPVASRTCVGRKMSLFTQLPRAPCTCEACGHRGNFPRQGVGCRADARAQGLGICLSI